MLTLNPETISFIVYYGQILSVLPFKGNKAYEIVYINVFGGHADQPVALHSTDGGLECLRECAREKKTALCIFTPIDHGHAVYAIFVQPSEIARAVLENAIARGEVTQQMIEYYRPAYIRK